MKRVKQGAVQVEVEEHLAPPQKAGRMSKKEVARLPKAPRGIGTALSACASAIERMETPIELEGITPEQLRDLGQRSYDIELVMRDLSLVMRKFSQARLLFDEEAYDKLRRVRDIVKGYAKRDPQLRLLFAPLFEFFGRSAKTRQKKQRTQPAPAQKVPLSVLKSPASAQKAPR